MPDGGDGAACPAASPGEERWVPRRVALARQRAQEEVRHASALPPVAVAKAPPPKPGVTLPQCKGGKDLTAVEPLEGMGGTTGCGDAGRAFVPPPTQLKASFAVSPYTSSTRVEGEENGGTAVTRHSGLFPKV
jgi:hypothetical protein